MLTREQIAKALCNSWNYEWELHQEGTGKLYKIGCWEIEGHAPRRDDFYLGADAVLKLFKEDN